MGRWKGCLWIDLNERIVASQKSHVASQTVAAGGSWTIPKVQNFAKTRLRRSFTAKLYKIIAVNSAKLLGFGPLHFDLPGEGTSVYTSAGGPRPEPEPGMGQEGMPMRC